MHARYSDSPTYASIVVMDLPGLD
ncbi:Protein of unknown function [Pyronema omphalodes CBS 100304]|uniref:Uncharacterized protein n=1 Tax=Pyronema omphalodes (strain CBS 100304) TaxID=1076935 RepID=U4KWX4_PYROM|nr:Protein of unknown function [Pyronema omphalodes CBS 100304]